MSTPVDPELVVATARQIVSSCVPQELPLFATTSKAYLRGHAKPGAEEQMLGFGTNEALIYLTPFIISITYEVLKLIAEDLIVAGIKRVAGIDDDLDKVPPLTSEQVARVQDLVRLRAEHYKIDSHTAMLLSHTVSDVLLKESHKEFDDDGR